MVETINKIINLSNKNKNNVVGNPIEISEN